MMRRAYRQRSLIEVLLPDADKLWDPTLRHHAREGEGGLYATLDREIRDRLSGPRVEHTKHTFLRRPTVPYGAAHTGAREGEGEHVTY
jgi:hypothetical protein